MWWQFGLSPRERERFTQELHRRRHPEPRTELVPGCMTDYYVRYAAFTACQCGNPCFDIPWSELSPQKDG